MRHLFLDTNVLIDYLLGRQPFADDAERLFNTTFDGQVTLYVASISFSNSYYIIRRQYRSLNVKALLADILPWLTVTDVTAAIIKQALAFDSTDFEDALQYYSACSNPLIEAIVTRNQVNFKLADLPVIEPDFATTFLS